MKPSEEQRAAVKNVLTELVKYHGEKVVAHEHSLHKAVVQLEKLCIKRPPKSKMSFVLFSPAKGVWFQLLWASRGSGSDAAMKIATQLSAMLEEWLVDIPLESYQGRGSVVGEREGRDTSE